MSNFIVWQTFILVWVSFGLTILARLASLRDWEDFIMGAATAIFVVAFGSYIAVGFVG